MLGCHRGWMVIGEPLTTEFQRADVLIEDGRMGVIDEYFFGIDVEVIKSSMLRIDGLLLSLSIAVDYLWQTTMHGSLTIGTLTTMLGAFVAILRKLQQRRRGR